jgi:hypothetical protein
LFDAGGVERISLLQIFIRIGFCIQLSVDNHSYSQQEAYDRYDVTLEHKWTVISNKYSKKRLFTKNSAVSLQNNDRETAKMA